MLHIHISNCRKYIIYYKDMNDICLYLTKKLQKKMSHSITTEYTHSLSYIETYITVKMNENVLCIIQPSLQDQIRNLTLGSVSYIIVLYILHTRQQAGNSYYLIYIKKIRLIFLEKFFLLNSLLQVHLCWHFRVQVQTKGLNTTSLFMYVALLHARQSASDLRFIEFLLQ